MLVAMRKHTKAIFITIIVLIVPAFIFFYVPRAVREARGGPKYGEIFGRSVLKPDFDDAARAQMRALNDLRSALLTMDYHKPPYWFMQTQRDLYLAQVVLYRGPIGEPDDEMREQVRRQFTDPETEQYDDDAYHKRLRELGMTDEQYVREFNENVRIISTFIDPVIHGSGEQGWQRQRMAAWERIMLAHEAKRLAITVSDQEVVNYLYLIVGADGRINEDRYAYLRRSANKTRTEYEDEVRTTIRITRLQQFILNSVEVPRKDVVEQFNDRYRRYKLAYHVEPSDLYMDPDAVRDDEAEAFYDDSRRIRTTLEPYTIKPQASVMYVLVEWADFEPEVELDEDQVKEYYESHQRDFRAEDGTVRSYEACVDDVRAAVRRIEAIKLAKEEATRLFLVGQPQALIQNASRYKRPDGTPYGLHTTPLFGDEGEIDGVIAQDEDKFRQAVFGLAPEFMQFRPKPGVVIGPVRVAQGWCVLAIVQMVPDATPRLLPRAEWLPKAREALARDRAATLAKQVADAQSEQAQSVMDSDGVDFRTACAQLGLDLEESPFFTVDDEDVPGLENSSVLVSLAVMAHDRVSYREAKPDELYTRILDEDAGAVLAALIETQPPDEQTVAGKEARFADAVVERPRRAYAYFEWLLALHKKANIVDLENERRMREMQAQREAARAAGGVR